MTLTLTLLTLLLPGAIAILVLRRHAHAMMRTRPRRGELTPAALGLAAESFTVTTPHGTMRGWHLHADGDAGALVVLAHGWRSHASDMLPWAAPLVRAGCDVFVYDALGHGESDVTPHTSLRHLRDDLRQVVTFAEGRNPDRKPMLLAGHSMGGAAAVLVAAERPDIAGLIIAGAPTDVVEAVREGLDERGLPGALMTRVMMPFFREILREHPMQIRPVTHITRVAAPLLVLHGTADRQIAARHARAMAEAAPDGTLVMLEGAAHNDLPQHAGYAPAVTGFVARALEGAGQQR